MTSKPSALGLIGVFAVSVAPLRGQVQAATLSVQVGGYSTVHNAYNLQTGTVDDFKTGYALGGSFGLQVHKYVELRATLTGAQSHLRVNGVDSAYLNRYYVGADVKGEYTLPGGATPYALAGGGVAVLHQKGTSGVDNSQGFGHIGLGIAYPVLGGTSLFVQGDGFFYSLSGAQAMPLSAYSSAQFDIAWSVGASHRFPF